MTDDEDEHVHPPLLSDSEPSDDEEDESSDDEDDSPLNRYLNSRQPPVTRRNEDQFLPGAKVWTEDSPQDDSRIEYQEVTAELLLNLLEMNEEEEAAMDSVTALEYPPVAEPDTAPEDELVSSTVGETPSEQTKVEKVFDSDEDQALIDCVNLDREAEGIFNRVGHSTSVYVTTSMWSYIINYPLSRMLKNMRISVKKLFTLQDRDDPGEIFWGDQLFSNPWRIDPQCRRGVLTGLGFNQSSCSCDYCASQSAPTNLRRGIRGKIRAVQTVPGQCQPGILGFGAPTPLVTLKVMASCQKKGSRIANLRVTPDTGATCDVIRLKIAEHINAVIEPNVHKYKLTDAQNVNIPIIGTTKLRLQRPGGEWQTIRQGLRHHC